MAMKTCCFCFDLKHGSNASATFVLVTRIIAIFISVAVLVILHQSKNVSEFQKEQRELSKMMMMWIDAILGVTIVLCSMMILFSIMLIIGVKKSKQRLFLPWIVMMGMEIGWTFLIVIRGFVTINSGGIYLIILSLIEALFNAYMLWCVVTYYKTLPYIRNSNELTTIESQGITYENQAKLM